MLHPFAPLPLRAAWAMTWTFSQRRQVYRCWVAWESAPACVAVQNLAYWCRHPRLYLDVRRRVRILQARRGYIDA